LARRRGQTTPSRSARLGVFAEMVEHRDGDQTPQSAFSDPYGSISMSGQLQALASGKWATRWSAGGGTSICRCAVGTVTGAPPFSSVPRRQRRHAARCRGKTMPTLRISTEKVCYVVVKAREFDVKVAPEWLDDGSNPTDDGMMRILEDYADDPTLAELRSYLRAMDDDELDDLVALTWIGRGDYTIDEWEDLMREVRDLRASENTVRYLIGIPLFGDYLEDGLNEFGLTCTD